MVEKMTSKLTRLELTWPGKEDRFNPEPRILLEDKEKSFSYEKNTDGFAKEFFDRMEVESKVKPTYNNMLIHGDNLLALKALEQDYTGKVKCIYIDPPYNTGNAFEHYDDGLEHSIWLSLMRDRLELLQRLLDRTGVIFVSIDDNEYAYLKVLMDEIFLRKNYCGTLVWEKKKKPSFLNANMGGITEYILAYAKDRNYSPPFVGGYTTENKKYPINNAGNSVQILTFPPESVEFNCPDGFIQPQDMSEGNIITELLDKLEILHGRNKNAFRLKGEWRYSQKKLDEIIANKERILISKIPFRPNHIKSGNEPKKMKNLLSIAHYNMATYEDATEESRNLFGDHDAFGYPKPEKLIQTLISAVTEPGDLVLDSFLGSGTTAAVAQKMGRRWIGVEMGDHVYTHCLPRLQKVIKGEDAGGVTKATGWTCGGGFKFYELASSLIVKDKYGQQIISDKYNGDMLAEAMCKILGYHYKPDAEKYWKQGFSSEKSFIFTTTMSVQEESLDKLAAEVGDNNLLICCSAFVGNKSAFPNITVKKIPSAILKKCEWGREGYPLNLKDYKPTDEEFEFEEE